MTRLLRSAWVVACLSCALAVACGDDGEPGGGASSGMAGESGSSPEAGEATGAGSSGRAGASGSSADAGEPGVGGGGGGVAGAAGAGGDGPSAVFCGNGEIEDGEECERRSGCAASERCTADCTCEPGPEYTPSSQELIELDYEAGAIDYPTSLLYRTWALFHAPELPEKYDGAGSIGEDTFLFLELSRVGALPTSIAAQIEPYTVRPDDPKSVFSQPLPPPAPLRARSPGAAPPPAPPPDPVGCPPNANGRADWRYHQTTHFVVWSCGGGVTGTDPFASARVVAGTMAEAAMAKMQPALAGIQPDDYPGAPADTRTDIYLLTPNQCRERNGFCTPIPNSKIAAAAPAKPCGAPGGGPIRSSAYLLLNARGVPQAVPADDAASQFRAIVVHELFHAISFGLNYGAQGGLCRGPQDPYLPPDAMRSWLTEASAEWASYAFAPKAWPERRRGLFFDYQINRDITSQGLHASTGMLPYEAFLYPLFVQEESWPSPQPMFDFWKGSGAARSRDDLDQRLNTVFSFEQHFRDFAVRNFNHDLPGTPIPYFHGAYDEAISLDDPRSVVAQPTPTLPAPVKFTEQLKLAPLSADTLAYSFPDSTRFFRIDAKGVSNVAHVHLDVLVKLDEQWERRRIDGPLFQFCRDRDGEDFSEIYVIVSNFDHGRAGRTDGPLEIETSTSCPGGWSGFMRVRHTYDSYYEHIDISSSEVKTTHNVETQEWSVTGSERYVPQPGLPPVDRARATFRGHTSMATQIVVTSGDCTETTNNTESGSGTHQELIDFSTAGNVHGFAPVEQYPGFDAANVYAVDACTGPQSSSSIHPHANMFAYLGLAPGLAMMVEDPNDPGHFKGTAKPIEQVTGEPGDTSTLTIEVEWDLRRTLDAP